MRSRLLEQLDKLERDDEAEAFEESFSMYKELLGRKKRVSYIPADADVSLEVVTSRDQEILSVSHLHGMSRRFRTFNFEATNVNPAKEVIFKLKDSKRAVFTSKSIYNGYIIRSGSRGKESLEHRTEIRAGDLVVVDVSDYQYIASFIERIKVPDEKRSLRINAELMNHFYSSVAIHALIFLLFVAGSWLIPKSDKLTKKKLDRFVTVNLDRLKQRPKPKPEPKPKPKIVKAKPKPEPKPEPKIVKAKPKPKPEPKIVKAKPKPKPVKKIVKKVVRKKQVTRAAVKRPKKSPGIRPKSILIARGKALKDARHRKSKNSGFTNKKAQAKVKKPRPSVASSSLFKGLGGIGPGPKAKGNTSRMLAAVTNIKGVKSSSPGVFNISGAIGQIGGKDIQVVRGGTVGLSGAGSVGGVPGGGRSSASGYIANVGKRVEGGGVSGAVLDFPEEEGKILSGEGSLSRSEILKVIERHARQFRYCYEKQLLKDPGLHGRVVLNWTISLSGSVSAAKWKSSELKSQQVNSCLVARLKDLRFPKPKGNSVTVDFPFVFTSASF